MRCTSSTFTRIKLRKRPKVNSKPFNLWYGIFSIGSIQLPEQPKGIGFVETLRNSIYLQIILVTSGTKHEVSNQKQKQPKSQFVELQIPTLNESSRYQFLLALLER